jgi:predicted ATP-dependent serine protease
MYNATINARGTEDLIVRTLHDLYNMPEEEYVWVVDGMLPVAGSGIFHSKPKDGKTTISRQLAVNVSQGRPFLGRNTLQGAVLYLALEEKLSEVAKHFKLLGAEETDPIYVITDCRGHNLSAIQQIIAEKKPVLMIVDTLAKFVDLRKSSEYGAVNDSVRPLHELARDSGTHVLCIHHSKKVSEEDSSDNMLGSIALAGAVDTIIGLRKTRNVRVISTSQRYGNPMEDTILTFDPDTRSVSLGSTTRAEVEEGKRSTLIGLSESIVEFVTNNPSCTESEVLAGVTGKRDVVRTQLRELLKSRLRREGKGVSGDPFLYYADVPIEAQDP